MCAMLAMIVMFYAIAVSDSVPSYSWPTNSHFESRPEAVAPATKAI